MHFELHELEARCLLSGEPWGAFDRLVDLDAATNSFPNITGAGCTIAVLDTGVKYSLPELGGGFGNGYKVVGGYDFVNNDANPDDTTNDGHGTATSCIAAGSTWVYQGYKYRGVAPGANIVALRIDDGSGNISDAQYQSALQWVINHRVQYNIVAVNISEGGDTVYQNKTTAGSSYTDELSTLKDAGVVIAVASGNDGVTNPLGLEYPAADPSAFAIGSLNAKNQVATHTTRSSDLDLLAPGESLPAVYITTSGQKTVVPVTGTSFAAPFVAGATALIKQINPGFSADQVVNILKQSGTDVYDSATGLTFKRIDLDNAMALAYAWSGQNIVPIGDDATDVDVAYGSNGKLYAAWYDAGAGTLDYASRGSSGIWGKTQIIDSAGDVGRWASIAIDSKGYPNIAYYDTTNGDLKYAHWNGTSWVIHTVDSAGTTGQRPSLAFNKSGIPGISYYDATNQDLRYATWGSGGWVRKTLDATSDSGKYSSIALNRQTNLFSIAYERTTGGLFRYAQQGTGGTWSFTTVDDTISGGGQISLAFDKSYRPAFSYYDATNADLKFAHRLSSSWSVARVASTGAQGWYTNLMFDQDGANIVYYNQSSDSVWIATGDIGHWSSWKLLASGGTSVTAAMNTATDTITLAFRQKNSNALHFADF